MIRIYRCYFPVHFSDWAIPIVPVARRDGSVRIWSEYKITLNRVLKSEFYPLLRNEELFSTLAGGVHFTKLDLLNTYHAATGARKRICNVGDNFHSQGIVQVQVYNHLLFGITTKPALLQQIMESLLQDIPCISIYLDGILVTGKTQAEHLKNLNEVLTRLRRLVQYEA